MIPNKLKCGHTLKQHQMMKEAKASSELEGAKTDKTICELIDMTTPNKSQRKICPNCGGDIAVRNPTGKCDHLYYPENVNKNMKKNKAIEELVYPWKQAPMITIEGEELLPISLKKLEAFLEAQRAELVEKVRGMKVSYAKFIKGEHQKEEIEKLFWENLKIEQRNNAFDDIIKLLTKDI